MLLNPSALHKLSGVRRCGWRFLKPELDAMLMPPRPVPLGFPAVTNGSNNVLRMDEGVPGPMSEIVTWI